MGRAYTMVSFYEFKQEDALRFAQNSFTRTKTSRNELLFEICPYCQSHKDKWKFSINLSTGQHHCKRASCGHKGNMITLARDFGFDLGRDVTEYYNIDNANAKYKNYGYFAEREVDKVAIEYLKTRGISPAITQKYQITTKPDQKNILVFPFLDEKSNLICIKYRNTDFIKGRDTNKEFFEKANKPYLFGVYQCEDFSRVIVTEGQIDSLSVAESGIKNAVSVPNGANGFTWVPHCWEWLSKFQEIVIMGDCERGEITLVDGISSRFSRSTVKVVRVADYRGCKDANELLQKHGKEAIIHAIDNAQTITSDGIKPAETVERVNYRDLPAFSTGVAELNKAMEGGLRRGDMVVVTGERGDGKSTFVSQMACFMLNNEDAKIFMYSGELVDSQVMEWMHSQLAGSKYYDDQILYKMQSWYAGRLYLYDNEYSSERDDEVYNRCVTAIEKYGCNIIILDNLMSAMGSTDSDLYRAQSKFARDCAKLSKEHNVVVILIAHPNKNGMQGNNNSVSGSADITNNATYIMWYQRTDKLTKNDRNLILSKNRTNGELIKEGQICLNYDPDSRRIFDDQAKDMRFGWGYMTEGEGFNPNITEDCPF